MELTNLRPISVAAGGVNPTFLLFDNWRPNGPIVIKLPVHIFDDSPSRHEKRSYIAYVSLCSP